MVPGTERGDSEQAIQLLLSANKIQIELRKLFQRSGIEANWEIVDRYAAADRETLRTCYYEEAVSDNWPTGKQLMRSGSD